MIVDAASAGQRLDRWLKQHDPRYHFAMVQTLLRKGKIRVNGAKVTGAYRLQLGDVLQLPAMQLEDADTPKRLSQEQRTILEQAVLFEDDHLLILNKPFGLAVQGGTGTRQHLDDWLERWALSREDKVAAKLTHRLDRDTTGVLLTAKTREAAAGLAKAFQYGQLEKTYWAVVTGVPKVKAGVIDAPLAKILQSHDRELMEIHDDGKPAVTHYSVQDVAGTKAAWLLLHPEQGRTHQLRVHCAAMGTPIYGDAKYGSGLDLGAVMQHKLHLHCRTLVFQHPITAKQMQITAPLPPHMAETWALFGWKNAV